MNRGFKFYGCDEELIRNISWLTAFFSSLIFYFKEMVKGNVVGINLHIKTDIVLLHTRVIGRYESIRLTIMDKMFSSRKFSAQDISVVVFS